MTKVLSPDIDQTVLEILTTEDVLKKTFEFSRGMGPRTITTTQLVVALGSGTDFKGLGRPQRTPESEFR